MALKMYVKSVIVDDQAHALDFYTRVLGFEVKHDVPAGDYRWITLVSPHEPGGVELALEPNAMEIGKKFQQDFKQAGIPFTAFSVDNIDEDYQRLVALGVQFTQEPMDAGGVKIAVFDDSCGNLIQLVEL